MASRHRLSALLNLVGACRPARKWVRECIDRGMTDYQIWRSCPGPWLHYVVTHYLVILQLSWVEDDSLRRIRNKYWPEKIRYAIQVPDRMQKEWGRAIRRIVPWQKMKIIVEAVTNAG